MDWRRTGDKEYPEDGQNCFIFFKETGYSISKFNWDHYEDDDGNVIEDMGKIATFSDRGGFLGDEDVLWVPLKEMSIPEEYKNDKKWKKWDDPEKVYKYVEAIDDLHYIRNPDNKSGYNYFELDIPKGSKLGITSSKTWKNNGILSEDKYSEVWQCVYDDGKEKYLVYVAPEQIK